MSYKEKTSKDNFCNLFFDFCGKGNYRKEILTIIEQILKANKIHDYRETFLGHGSIAISLLNRNKWLHSVMFNDTDPSVATLWNDILFQHENLVEKIRCFVPSEEILFKLRAELKTPDLNDTDLGFKKLVMQEMKTWNRDKLIARIKSVHDTLTRFYILNTKVSYGDYNNILTKTPPRSLIYLCPPYYRKFKNKGFYKYPMQDSDHFKLAESLKNCKHVWVLSYDNHPVIKELYSWAKIRMLKTRRRNSIGKKSNREIIISNVPIN